jgi:FkbM family methyltransferase
VRFTTDRAAWGNRIATDDRGVLVPAITIEELCKQNGIEKIDLLKLDIEGAEEQVLENGTFLARTEHIIVGAAWALWVSMLPARYRALRTGGTGSATTRHW